jgi:Ring finger domain
LVFARDGPTTVREYNKDEKLNGHASTMESSNCSEISDETDDGIESSQITNRFTHGGGDAYGADAQLYLRLPVKDEQGNSRIVDGHCAICFSDYEPDDKVVWSGLQCQHAFHADCILPWLANGKRRCPTCRQWFVPGTGTRIEDQKQEPEEGLRAEADASSSETTDETSQDGPQSRFENSSTAVGLGTAEDSQPIHVSLPIDVDVECGNADPLYLSNSTGM